MDVRNICSERITRNVIIILFGILISAALCVIFKDVARWKTIEGYRQAIVENSYVAHALGGINGTTYTNSKEALANANDKGFKFYEADIRLTSDGELVLTHGWDMFEGNPTSYSSFMESLVQGSYTAMDFADLVQFMSEYSDVYIMLDFGEQDFEYTKKAYEKIVDIAKDPEILDRMIVGGHSTKMIEAIQEVYDFKLYNLYWANKKNRVDERIDTKEEFLEYCRTNMITSVSTSVSTYQTEEKAIKYLRDNGLIVYLYTIDDETEAKRYFGKVDLIGTNFIKL